MNRWSIHFGILAWTAASLLGCGGKLRQDGASHSAAGGEAQEMAAASHDPGLNSESDADRDSQRADREDSARENLATYASGPPPPTTPRHGNSSAASPE